MKASMICALTAAVLIPTTAAATPKQDKTNPSIVVQAKTPTLHEWGRTVSQKLGRKLRYPEPPTGSLGGSGIVAVRFLCPETGKPEQVTLRRASGTRQLDREALRAVSAIKSFGPLPAGLKPGQVFEAKILFASTQEEMFRQMAELRKEAEHRNAWFREDGVIAINASPAVSGRGN